MATRKRTSKSDGTVEILDDLVKRYYKELDDKKLTTTRLGDLLKMIELKHKLAPDKSGNDEFWKMLQQIRREKLGRKTTPTPRKARPKPKSDKDA